MDGSALVTGGASGLGAATAARLAVEGLQVTRLDRAASLVVPLTPLLGGLLQ